ncbi:MAG TPA: choice-of-anchor tandem repeat GloVer-containing protein [Verrucomicrobiae bacterium]|nr:choice-of-anchor tandem repeat GloVer-containing protein [Verrucomicrobiae bacterium]
MPRALSQLKSIAPLQGSRRLDLAIALPLRNREELTNLLQRLYDPGSFDFHKFLSPQEFARRFGPTEQDYLEVMEFARRNHMIVTGTHPNRAILDVNASAADIERAFRLKLSVYKHPEVDRTFFAPETDPLLESQLPVLSIAGLDNFVIPRPASLRFSAETGTPYGAGQPSSRWPQPNASLDATGSGPAGTFLGRDFRAAYAPGLNLDGAGESIGLFELDSYFPGDVAAYEDLAGISQVPLTNILVNGFNQLPGGNNGEVALDIEMAISMAPGLDQVIVYEGTNPNDVLNRMATDGLARQLSCSWNFGHPQDPAREQIFLQMAAQGQAFFIASGDGGAYGAGIAPPSDDPWVTSVGGSSLVTASAGGEWKSESVWTGSGGGVSTNYTIPAWQRPIDMSANQGSSTMRNIPDVSALADAMIWVVANNGEQGTASGTSAAAPLWAGFAALVNQQAARNQLPPVGFFNPALYAIAQGPAYGAAFHDIVSGNNTNSRSPSRFFARNGYDLCTGWGTPNGSNLVEALLAPADSLRITPSAVLMGTGPSSGPFSSSFDFFSLSNALGNLSWSIGNVPSWLSVTPTSGTNAPGGAPQLVTVSFSPAASNLLPGSYTATLLFTNLNTGFAQIRLVTLAIVTPPVITSQPASLTLPFGATARFSAATAPNAALDYQWLRNGIPLQDSARVAGVSSSTLTLSDASSADLGAYSLLVSNAAGIATSSAATLTLTSSPPFIASQPASQTALPGAPVSFSVSAFGDPPLSYRWRLNGIDLLDGPTRRGSSTNTLTLNSVSALDAGAYSVVISNRLGVQTTAEAALQVVSLTSSEIVQSLAYSFEGTNGAHPTGLSRGASGRIYGATHSGGANDAGTLFLLSSARVPVQLYSFQGLPDGAHPNGELIESSDAAILGTASSGGSNAFGTVFKLSSNNTFTALFTLDHTNGVLPASGLTPGNRGSLFGTAYEGGLFHYGTLFALDTNGQFSVVMHFANTNGAFPRARLLQTADGSFYGTTYKGGLFGYGTVLKISSNGVFSTVASFDGNNGAFPASSLVQANDGAIYGTTVYGGAFNLGTIFKIGLRDTLTNLVSFSGISNGSHPRAGLMQSSDGNLYGAASDGGSFGVGTLFRLSPGGILSTIAEFDGYNGARPEAALLEDSDASLIGVTRYGGAADKGVLFRLQTGSAPNITSQPAALTTYEGSTVSMSVACFGAPPLFFQWQKDGTNLVSSGNVLGSNTRVLTLTNVGALNQGAYSVIVTNELGSAVSIPASLSILNSAPVILLQPTNQTLAPGATAVLHAEVSGNMPLTYQWQLNNTNISDTSSRFGSTGDTLVLTNVTEADNGSYVLSITNSQGQTDTVGTVLSVIPVSAPGTKLSTLYSFGGGSDGGDPSRLTDGHDGFLYGTTEFGGDVFLGSAFKIGTNSGLVTFASFDPGPMAFPINGLVFSTNGVFYGTSAGNGSSALGAVYSITPAGQRSLVYPFLGTTDGAIPNTPLIQGTDGFIYGSTRGAGGFGKGTLFSVSSQGGFIVLHSFTGGADGSGTGGALLELPGHDFYAVTPDGGFLRHGSLLRFNQGFTPETLYSFTGGQDGFVPVGAVAVGDDGALYGVTMSNSIRGFSFYGTVFRADTNGSLTTLYSLNFTDGSYPAAGLVLGADGNFYGTTQQGGTGGFGTVFRITPDGTFSTLVEFDGFNDGAVPKRALTCGPDGNLYGVTSSGGPGGAGTVFRLSFTGPPTITEQPKSQTGLTGEGTFFAPTVSGAFPMFFQWRKDGTNLLDGMSVSGSTNRVLRLSNLQLSDAGTYSLMVSNAAGTSTSIAVTLSVAAPPPRFQAVQNTSGNLLLTWTSVSGRSYQLQSAATPVAKAWINVGTPVVSSGSSVQVSVTLTPGTHQFYRVVLLP